MLDLAALADAIAAVAPIETVRAVNGEVAIVFAPEATTEQRASAHLLLDAFDPDAPVVPQQVSPYQARMALLNAGLLAAVEALMAAPEVDSAAKIAWEYATVWERGSAFIATLAPALGLSDSEIDDLFIAAAQVT